MNINRVFSVCVKFFVIMSGMILSGPSHGQVTVSASVSDDRPLAGQVVRLVISIEDEVDFYGSSVELSYNGAFEFYSFECGELVKDGLKFAGNLGPGRIGASVSRTEPLAEFAAGSFMVFEFRVVEFAYSGEAEIILSNLLIHDSSGEQMTIDQLSPVLFEIGSSISHASLSIPPSTTVEPGELFFVMATVFASGLSDPERIVCQAGLSRVDTDPEYWENESWLDMDHMDEGQNGSLGFLLEVANMRPPGDWFIAIRASLDGGNYVYGGLGGIWDIDEHPSASLTISEQPPFRYTLAKWDFENESLLPSIAVPENIGVSVELFGANLTGFMSGYTGQAANSNQWSNGSGYWRVGISSADFASLQVSSKQYGSGTGPRDFALQYSLDGTGWHSADGGEITVENNWSRGRLDQLPLPDFVEDRQRLYLRWFLTSDISINGGVVGSTGTNRIDDIIITGVNKNPEFVEVYPGDTNNDGVVNADDVLPLGSHWLKNGPTALWESLDFSPRTSEQWIPSDATYADTNGDGIIDHKDLMAVGLNFGKTTDNSVKEGSVSLSTLEIDPVEDGRVTRIIIAGSQETELRGVAFNIEFEGIPEGKWEVRNIVPAFFDDPAGDQMIYFGIPVGNNFEAALAMKGGGDNLSGKWLAGFEIVIDEEWNDIFSVNLNRLTISNCRNELKQLASGSLMFHGSLSSTEMLGEPNYGTILIQNYPNPFGSQTTVPFQVKEPSRIRLDVADLEGRVLFTAFDGYLINGMYEKSIDFGAFPPGIYLCSISVYGRIRGVIKMVKAE